MSRHEAPLHRRPLGGSTGVDGGVGGGDPAPG